MDKLERALKYVAKPARYCGGEWNMAVKQPDEVELRFAFAFPDTYEIGMSHLGLKILYHILNSRQDTYCERLFAPWTDMEEIMRREDIPLFSLETKSSAADFDIIGFTLQYEMCYTNILNMLDLSGIPIESRDRGEEHPFVIAGGPCACNPFPLSPFIDFFVLGDGEEIINEIADLYINWKRSGQKRQEFIEAAAKLDGVFVPSKGTPAKKRIIKELDTAAFPKDIIVPFMGTVHDRVTLEIMRGCTRGCRFCQAGYIYRPVRERGKDTLIDTARCSIDTTGYDEISLSSLSSGDYSELAPLIKSLISDMKQRRVSVSLPSLRIDSFAKEYIEDMPSVRKSGLTFAPEAGTQRLRDVINKNVTEEDMLSAARSALEAGWNTVKLYFMIGLPTETEDDIRGIAELAEKVAREYYSIPRQMRAKGLKITVSTSSFVPKPHTPFQWVGQASIDELYQKQRMLKSLLDKRYFSYNWHDPKLSMLEAVFARGGEETSAVLAEAFRAGCRFDSWNETFDFDKWRMAFEKCGLDMEKMAQKQFEPDEPMPWDIISYGVTKEFLLEEYQKALREDVTDDCRLGCHACGLQEVCL